MTEKTHTAEPNGTQTGINLPAEYERIATICAATEVLIGSQMVMGVMDARDLHSGLAVGRVFGAWIEARIKKYAFKAGADYEVYSHSGNNPQGGRPENVYRLTLDMAKELAMLQNNQVGRQVRKFFIQKEKELVTKMSQLEDLLIPDNFGYDKLVSLSNEARQKFTKIRPRTLGQASRISGVNPSDVQILMVFMGR